MIDLTQVRSFVAVAAELHFGRAARRLNMTQPPLSRQIRLLEDYLGARLFDRTAKSVTLTPAGRTFLPQAQSLLNHANEAESSIRQTTQTEGTVRLAFFGLAAFRLLPRIMARATQQYPRIALDLREMNAVSQINAFAFGELDLGIVRPMTPPPPALTMDTILRERLLVALPHGHALTRTQTIRLSDLNNQPFIAYSTEAPYLHQLQRALFTAHQIHPVEQHRLAHSPALLSLVAIGLGIAVIPEQARHAVMEGVTFRPLALPAPTYALTHLVSQTGLRRPPVDCIHRLIAEVCATIESEDQRS